MTLPKIIIGGLATVIVVAGAYYFIKNPSMAKTPGQILLNDYQELFAEINDPKTKNDLSDNCSSAQKFTEQIQALTNKLESLTKRKNDLINASARANQETEQNNKEWIPPIPGSEVPDLSPMPESDADSMRNEDEWIPPIPGSETPDLEPMPGSEVGPRQSEEWIPPIPGSEVPDLEPMPGSEVDPRQSEEWIPPIPGSEVPDLSPMPESDTEPIQNEDEWIPPIPGSEVPDLEPMPGEITIFAELLEINNLEEKINLTLNNLKTICDKETKKEIISASCTDACNKYSDCAGYTEGATKEDQKDAFDSCMIECAKWSDKTKICINKKPIKTVSDCTNLSICALKEYNNALDN